MQESKIIQLFSDNTGNIVIFPFSTFTNAPLADGLEEGWPYTAYYPIELKANYDMENLSQKIREGFDCWCKYPHYNNFTGKNTYEEKYFGIKGLKKAVLGKKLIRVTFDVEDGYRISLSLPTKGRGYEYLRIESTHLAKNASIIEVAQSVSELINLDLNSNETYRVLRKNLL